MQRKVLTAPLTETLTGYGSPVAEFGSQWLHKSGSSEIVVKKFVHQPYNIAEKGSAVYESLVDGGRAGDIEVISSTSVKFSINSVQRK